jgi:hypothetical protein
MLCHRYTLGWGSLHLAISSKRAYTTRNSATVYYSHPCRRITDVWWSGLWNQGPSIWNRSYNWVSDMILHTNTVWLTLMYFVVSLLYMAWTDIVRSHGQPKMGASGLGTFCHNLYRLLGFWHMAMMRIPWTVLCLHSRHCIVMHRIFWHVCLSFGWKLIVQCVFYKTYHALALLMALLCNLFQDWPIIFVVHSLGGIILKSVRVYTDRNHNTNN